MPTAVMTAEKCTVTVINRNFSQMTAHNSDEQRFYERIGDKQAKKGMDYFPMEIFNALIEHTLSCGKFRDAMLLVCMANWGMRFSDLCRVRYGHIFDKDGYLKKAFTLPDGEQKTGKENIYYNNEATATVIDLYLKHNLKSPYDYLFTSNSMNAPKKTLREIEAEEMYGHRIELAEKRLNQLKKQQTDLLKVYSKDMLSEEEFTELNADLRKNRCECESELVSLKSKLENYTSKTHNADRPIRTHISRQAAEGIIKNNLAEIGIFPRNRKNNAGEMNLDKKFNTHSLRKTFAENFVDVGTELNRAGELDVDTTVINLLQHKFKHDSMRTTNRYDQTEEKAFREICTDMNIGLEVLRKFV